MSEYAINLNTGRTIRKSTSLYKKLRKLNQVKEIDLEAPKTVSEAAPSTPAPKPEPPEFDEKDLQMRMADLTTDMIQKNFKKVVKAQKLSDAEYDILLKQMLYEKLCMTEPKPKKPSKQPKKVKKARFKIVEPSSSEESESD
jgi:hypothetical protein